MRFAATRIRSLLKRKIEIGKATIMKDHAIICVPTVEGQEHVIHPDAVNGNISCDLKYKDRAVYCTNTESVLDFVYYKTCIRKREYLVSENLPVMNIIKKCGLCN